MIFQSSKTADYLLPDKSFWTRMLVQDLTEISKIYRILCPSILYAEIYEGKGHDKLLENSPEVYYVDPWIILVKNELEGHSIFQDDNISPINLKLVNDMDEEEKNNTEVAKKMIEAFNKGDKSLSNRTSRFRNSLASFANSSYQKLTCEQFFQRVKECTDGTIYERISKIAEDPKYDKNISRTVIQEFLYQYKNLLPINTFGKAFALAQNMVREDFSRICYYTFIRSLEKCSLGFDRTYWDKVENKLRNNNINNLFPYTQYSLQLCISLLIYQHENQYNKEIEATDFEYLYYLYFSDVLFVSADHQHKIYINETGILNSRRNGSFAYILQEDQNRKEYDRVMNYIKNKSLH
ncbi:MAG: hypothetical protein OXM61_08085 [Candidatus Poribacteria bacterium]|nr:hypothetical protein [Candidatus Poribacteria bacterium]